MTGFLTCEVVHLRERFPLTSRRQVTGIGTCLCLEGLEDLGVPVEADVREDIELCQQQWLLV